MLTIPGKKTVFLSHLYIKMIIMPRQARDKHRENSKRETGFLQSSSSGCSKSATRGANEQLLFWSHFILKMLVSTQTGSGQTSEKLRTNGVLCRHGLAAGGEAGQKAAAERALADQL